MNVIPAATLAASVLVAAPHAHAVQIQCAKHSLMLNFLAKKFSEKPAAMGTVNSDRYMQLFVSSGGTWTIVITETDGQSCIVAAGENWESLPQMAGAAPGA